MGMLQRCRDTGGGNVKKVCIVARRRGRRIPGHTARGGESHDGESAIARAGHAAAPAHAGRHGRAAGRVQAPARATDDATSWNRGIADHRREGTALTGVARAIAPLLARHGSSCPR
jgi:hypothetical protein